MTDDSVPHKRCKECGGSLPATTEYFYRVTETRLEARCKRCRLKRMAEHRSNNREVNRKRAKDWYHANRDRAAEKGKRYYAKNRAKIAERNHRHYIENTAKYAARAKRYYQENREQYLERCRIYRELNRDKRRAYGKLYYKLNKVKIAAKSKRYREENREKCRGYIRRYYHSPHGKAKNTEKYHRRRRASNEDFTAADVLLQMKSQKERCWWCGEVVGKNYHVDHLIPLVKGGTNHPRNIVISCPHCNLSKGAKLPKDWNGRLF